MTNQEVLTTLESIFQEALGRTDISLTETTTAQDVDGWDSISHLMLVVEIEKRFKTRFKAREIQRWANVGDIVASIIKQ